MVAKSSVTTAPRWSSLRVRCLPSNRSGYVRVKSSRRRHMTRPMPRAGASSWERRDFVAPGEGRGDADLVDPWAAEESSLASGARVGVESSVVRSGQGAPSVAVQTARGSEDVLPVASNESTDGPPGLWDGPDSDLEDAGLLEDFAGAETDDGPEQRSEEPTYGSAAEGVLHVGESAFDDAEELPGLEDLVDHFDPEASRSPWDSEVEEDPWDYRSSEKAAKIARLLMVRRESERATAFTALQDLFTEHPHPATFRAITGLCRAGIDLDMLMTTVTLRDLWLDEPCTWQRRGGGLHLPSWELALRVAEARADWPVEEMLDPGWLQDWHSLALGSPGYPSLAAYVEVVLERIPRDPRWAELSRRASAFDQAVTTADLSGNRRRLDCAVDRADKRSRYYFEVEAGTTDSRNVW